MTGFVYAIDDRQGAVKIGFTNNVRRRLAELNVSDPSRLTLLGYVRATQAQEIALHQLLASSRIRGEWYRRTHAVSLFLDMLPKPAASLTVRRLQKPRSDHPLARFREDRGLTMTEFAKILGTTKCTVSRLEAGKQVPSLALVKRIVEVTNGHVGAEAFFGSQRVV